ncbi:MAG: hypothetical protein WAX89_02515 [Alphaproteobacteria bacterium]
MTISTRTMSFIALAALAAVVLVAPEANAAFDTAGTVTAGTELSKTIVSQLQGGWGIAIGLVMAAYGLYTWLIKQETWGVLVIFGGIFLTILPTFMAKSSGAVKATVEAVAK